MIPFISDERPQGVLGFTVERKKWINNIPRFYRDGQRERKDEIVAARRLRFCVSYIILKSPVRNKSRSCAVLVWWKIKRHPVLSSEDLTHPTRGIFSDRVYTRLGNVTSFFLSVFSSLLVWLENFYTQTSQKKVPKLTTLWTCDHVSTKYNKIILVIMGGIKLQGKEQLFSCIQQWLHHNTIRSCSIPYKSSSLLIPDCVYNANA